MAELPLEIVPLTPENWDALAALFEEGGDPKWCWYQWQVGGGLRVQSLPRNRRASRTAFDSFTAPTMTVAAPMRGQKGGTMGPLDCGPTDSVR